MVRKQALEGKVPNVLIYLVDAVHQFRIRHFIETFGYPTYKNVGSKALHAFWLLIQHQDYDLNLQKECLEKCGFKKEDYAYLTDRVAVNENKPQTFGTQFVLDKKGKRVPYLIKDKKNLNKRRGMYDLCAFEEYVARNVMLSKDDFRK